jgi:hypothetical protein
MRCKKCGNKITELNQGRKLCKGECGPKVERCQRCGGLIMPGKPCPSKEGNGICVPGGLD